MLLRLHQTRLTVANHTSIKYLCATTGDELTVSYLGREEFAPVGARQAVLQERWGFACGCARCQLEQKAPKALQRSLEQIYATVARVSTASSCTHSLCGHEQDGSCLLWLSAAGFSCVFVGVVTLLVRSYIGHVAQRELDFSWAVTEPLHGVIVVVCM